MKIELVDDNCIQVTLENTKHTIEEEGETLYYLGYGDADLEVRKICFKKYKISPYGVKNEFLKQMRIKYKEATKGDLANQIELNALRRVNHLEYNFEWATFEKNLLSEAAEELLRAVDETDESYNGRVEEFNTKDSETVKHPNHYMGKNNLEVIDVIRDFELNFNLGNVVKYVLRAGKKGNKEEDLRKAIQYLKFELGNYEDTRRGKPKKLSK